MISLRNVSLALDNKLVELVNLRIVLEVRVVSTPWTWPLMFVIELKLIKVIVIEKL